MKNVFVKFCVLVSLMSCVFVMPGYASDLYVGFAGGAQKLTSDVSVDYSYPGIDTAIVSGDFNSSNDSGMGDFYFGVVSQPIPNKMSLALEFNLTGFLAETEEHYSSVDSDLTMNTQWKYNLGVSLIPGVLLGDKTTVYTRMGLGYGEYTNKVSGTLQENPPYIDIPGYTQNFSEHDFSYRLGVGIEQQIHPQWSLRLEYDYWHYNAVNPDDSHYGSGNPTVVSYTLHPESNTIMLGLSYHYYQSGGADLVL